MREVALIGVFVQREIQLEFRRKSIFAGIALYLFSLTFICYLTFSLQQNVIGATTWSALFWLVILFTAVNSIAKSFISEKRGVGHYHYYLVSPGVLILARIIFNFLQGCFLALGGFLLFSIFIGSPIQEYRVFLPTLILASWGFAASLTLVSALAARTANENVLMAVLSFPLVVAILLLTIRATKNALDGLDFSASQDELINLFAINCILTGLAYILFPYIWRS